MISDVEDFQSVKDLFYLPNYFIFMHICIQATKKRFEIKFESGGGIFQEKTLSKMTISLGI